MTQGQTGGEIANNLFTRARVKINLSHSKNKKMITMTMTTARPRRPAAVHPLVFIFSGLLLCLVRFSSAFTSSTTKTTTSVVVGGPFAATTIALHRSGRRMPSARRASESSSSSPRRDRQYKKDDADDCYDDVVSIHRRREVRRREFILRSSVIASTSLLLDLDSASAASDSAEDDATYIDPSLRLPIITHRAYLDVEFGNKGGRTRLIIGLFGNDMPRTVNNFLALCSSGGGGGDGDGNDGPTYAGSTFYRGWFFYGVSYASRSTHLCNLFLIPKTHHFFINFGGGGLACSLS